MVRCAVYGEMVAVLWESGDVLAALELETLWNNLRAGVPFALLCGYPSHALGGEQLACDVLSVCHLHSEVAEVAPVSGDGALLARAERCLSPSPRAPRAARDFVQSVLEQWGRQEFGSAAALAVTELVSNAVTHAQSDMSVRLTSVPGALRVAVHDNSALAPEPRVAAPDEATGRGLALIAALASNWGTEFDSTGKTVWVEFRASRAQLIP